MSRDTKVGLVIVCSFVFLFCTIVVYRLRAPENTEMASIEGTPGQSTPGEEESLPGSKPESKPPASPSEKGPQEEPKSKPEPSSQGFGLPKGYAAGLIQDGKVRGTTKAKSGGLGLEFEIPGGENDRGTPTKGSPSPSSGLSFEVPEDVRSNLNKSPELGKRKNPRRNPKRDVAASKKKKSDESDHGFVIPGTTSDNAKGNGLAAGTIDPEASGGVPDFNIDALQSLVPGGSSPPKASGVLGDPPEDEGSDLVPVGGNLASQGSGQSGDDDPILNFKVPGMEELTTSSSSSSVKPASAEELPGFELPGESGTTPDGFKVGITPAERSQSADGPEEVGGGFVVPGSEPKGTPSGSELPLAFDNIPESNRANNESSKSDIPTGFGNPASDSSERGGAGLSGFKLPAGNGFRPADPSARIGTETQGSSESDAPANPFESLVPNEPTPPQPTDRGARTDGDVVPINGGDLRSGTDELPSQEFENQGRGETGPNSRITTSPINTAPSNWANRQTVNDSLNQGGRAGTSGNLKAAPKPGARHQSEQGTTRNVLSRPPGGPNDRRHLVQHGDSFWSIAEEYYGSGRYYKELEQYNLDRIGKETQSQWRRVLRAGDVVSLPERAALDVLVVRSDSRRPLSREASEDILARGTYRVISGDTLSSIALRVYGTSRKWEEIFGLNRQLLAHPDRLHEGMELILPMGSTATNSDSNRTRR